MNLAAAGDPYERRRIDVLDTDMAYVDVGRGRPVVFLHGNPTSSFLWRGVIPYVAPVARCLAPDLVGMGQSGKPPSGAYRFVDHARYLDAWFDAMDLRHDVTLVVHDWGSALGFHWAQRHPDRVAGVVYMEAIVRPVSWDEWPENARKIFQAMRSPAGDDLVLQKNVFVERILPASVIRPMTGPEMEVYRAPYRNCLAHWNGPKLFVNADPGSILVGAQREFCRTWPNQDEVTVKGVHFIQEDSPREIGEAVRAFVERRTGGR
jgi:haloalkane dehalogenase